VKAVLIALALILAGVAAAQPSAEDTVVIAYDDSIHRTWWCSDRDSFGAAVKFTPAEYPCQVVGTKAEVGYDEGCNIYLRVYDDDSTNGLPGHILYDQLRSDIPPGQNVGFRDYDLTSPVTIEDGDFYICFFQKHWFHLLFGTDTNFDYPQRQWWYFPDWGWVTPMGMDAADQLIRAKVVYPTGIEEELGSTQIAPRLTISPNPVHSGYAVLRWDMTSAGQGPIREGGHDPGSEDRNGSCPQNRSCPKPGVAITDATGNVVRTLALENGSARLDANGLPDGIYFARVTNTDLPVAKVIIAH